MVSGTQEGSPVTWEPSSAFPAGVLGGRQMTAPFLPIDSGLGWQWNSEVA